MTYHNDNSRTGQNLTEAILNHSNVNSSSFGKLFTVAVDGKVDAQPLYVSSVTIPGTGVRNVVYAETEHGSVYAFDADGGAVYWHLSLLQNGETPSDPRSCGQVSPEIGITATPVIDLTAGPHGTIYILAMSKDAGGNYHQRLHALDITTGAEEFGGPVSITASYPGSGDNSTGGQVVFDPKQYKSRPGLMLLDGTVYTGWGSHCDIRPYTGWLLGYNRLTLQQSYVFNFAPNGEGAALWGAGGGIAADASGNIFVQIANGTFDTTLTGQGFPVQSDYGNAFVKLALSNGQLAAQDYWTMDNTVSESNSDEDLGSGSLTLLPDLTDSLGRVRHLGTGAGKDGNVYVFDRDNLGKFNASNNSTLYQEIQSGLGGQEFAAPAWFNGTVYYGAVGDVIRAFQVNSALLSTTPASSTSHSFAFPGVTPAISANGSSNGILWAVENSNPAVLHAYDATNLANELYNSNQAASARDQFGAGNKFITPTIANGKVFVGTTNSVAAFGLFTVTPSFALVPGALQQVSVGTDGSLWGINSANAIFSYNTQSGGWIPIPGELTSIAVSSSNTIWGLNASGQIYRWDGSAQGWDNIAGNLSSIAVGGDGDVWGLNSAGQIWRFNSATEGWTYIPNILTQIAVGFDGAVWGLNSAQQIWRFNPGSSSWEAVAGNLTQISVGTDGDVWGLNSGDEIFHFNRQTQNWESIAGTLSQISVGSGSNVWGVNSAGNIFHFDTPTQSWVAVAGTLAKVSAAENGAVWGVSSSDNIYQYNQATTATQTLHALPGTLAQLSAGADGDVWGLDSTKGIWSFNPLTQNWTRIAGELAQIAVGFGGEVWGLNGGEIWRYDAANQNWDYIPGTLTQIAVGAGGEVWGLNAGGQIWRYDRTSNGWDYIPGTLSSLSVGADGTVWGLNSAQQIWRYNAGAQTWDYIPGNLTQIAVGSSINVWGINSAGQIWRFDSANQGWQYVPGTLTSISVAFDGAVWGLNSAGQIWRYDAPTQSWVNIPGSLRQISVGADAAVWGLDAAGSIYRYW